MKKAILATLFTLTIGTAGMEARAAIQLPKPEVETLSNGMRIVWFTNDKLPIVDLAMTIKSGTQDDLPGKSGTAELVAATLDRGAAGMTAREIAKTIESLGASRNATVDDDFFQIHFHGLAMDADTLLDLMAKLALHPDFPADEIKHQRARMVDSWNRMVDYGDSLVDLAFRRMLTQNTRYARGSIDSTRELEKIDRRDAIEWWKRCFSPSRATLLIVGRVDRKEFKEKILTLFGEWKTAGSPASRRPYRSLNFTPRPNEVVLLDRPNLNQAQVRMGFRAPLVQDSRHYPLTVANALLGEYFHSRLNTLIRDQLGLTYGIASSISYNKNLAALTISAATRNEATAKLIQKSLEVLRGLKSRPIPDEEVATAKDFLIGGFPLSTSTLESVAGRWLISDLFELGPDRLNEFVPKISSVTPVQVSSAIASGFNLKEILISVAGDAKTIEPVLKKAGFRVRVLNAHSILQRPSK